MKKKQFMSKLAALTMAAAMGLTAAPSTVFAQTVAVEADDASIPGGSVTVSDQNGKITSGATGSVYAIVNALTYSTTNDVFATGTDDNFTVTGVANTIKDALDGNVSGVTFTGWTATISSDKKTLTVTFSGSDGKNYTVVAPADIVKDLAAETDADSVAKQDQLTAFFDDTTNFSAYSNTTITDAVVLAKVNDAAGAGKALSNFASVKSSLAVSNVKADATNGTFTGRLSYTESSVKYYYDFSGTFEANQKTKTELIADGLAAVKDKVYYGATTDQGKVLANLTEDVNKALDLTGTPQALAVSDFTVANYTGATHDKDGSLTISNDNVYTTFTIKHDSASKLTEADKEIKDGLKGSTSDAAAKLEKDAAGKAVKSADNGTGKFYVFSENSSFSRALQSSKATTAVEADAVKDAVLKAVTDKVAADKKDTDGVTYAAEVVGGTYSATTTNGAETATVQKATGDNGGHYVIKVTATTDNTNYGYDVKNTAANKEKTTTNTWYVIVNTKALDGVDATAISLDDKTVVEKYNVKSRTNITEFDKMIVELKPSVTPDGANKGLTYKIEDKDGNDITSQVTGITVYDKDNKSVALKNGDGKLAFSQEGTYKVTVSQGDVKDEATVKILDSFKDVPSTAYYKHAVSKAYASGVTNGISDTQFGVNDDVTRAQFITWLYNYAVSQDEDVAIKDADVKQVFSDVPTTAYYAKAVQWAAENKYAAGTGDGKFSPNAAVTRAQAVTFIYNVNGKPATGALGEEGEKTTQFTDVDKNAYYMPALTWGTPDVVSGLSSTTFGPDKTASRAQGISFIARAFKFDK